MYISKHRRFSQACGGGVQYIPGHVEPFVDRVVSDFLPLSGKVVELGGAGLRFAIPVAAQGRAITVVDLDHTGLDIEQVVRRANAVGDESLDAQDLVSRIHTTSGDALEFLRSASADYTLIAAFRLAHFFSPEEMQEFFSLVYSRLIAHGSLAVSAMTPFNLPGGEKYNEIFCATEPCDPETPLYRVFQDTPESISIRESQNLGNRVNLVDSALIHQLAATVGFEVVVDSFKSTRIVAGFVLRKPAA